MAAAYVLLTVAILIVLGASVIAYYWYRSAVDQAQIDAKLEHRRMDEEIVREAERERDERRNR